MSFDIQSINFALGENQVEIETLCANVGRNYEKLIARSGFTRVHRTSLTDSEFFSTFLNANLTLSSGDFVVFVNQSIGSLIPGGVVGVFLNVPNSSEVNIIEISDGCSGFVRALLVADALINSYSKHRVHIVCAEKYSNYFEESDSSVSPIFSDAISLCTLVPGTKFRIANHHTRNDYSQAKSISTFSQTSESIKLQMEGSSVLSWTLSNSTKTKSALLAGTELQIEEIDEWFLHQGSKVVVQMVSERLGIKSDGIFSASEIGNTVSSSIPIALKERLSKIEVEPLGRNIALLAFGVGVLSLYVHCLRLIDSLQLHLIFYLFTFSIFYSR